MSTDEQSTSGAASFPPRFYLALAAVALAGIIILSATGRHNLAGPFAVGLPVVLAMYVRKHPALSVTTFSVWMIACIAAPMYYPAVFLQWGPLQLQPLIIPLIMSVLFCMGTTLSLKDFRRVLAMPQAVLIGIFLTFTLMPLIGKGVAVALGTNNEVAAGMVLVGACPGGVASNVITYLAGGNVALSVTMTAVGTLVSPFATPTLTKWLAGTYVPVSFVAMMLSIVKMVILPITGGLILHDVLERLSVRNPFYRRVYDFIMKFLPKFSMFAILMACAILTANARDQLLIGSVVVSVLVSVVLQNFFGLLFGYWLARLTGLGEKECRTVAIEVGLKNSGMAAGLALDVLHSELASIPGVVYSSWHNITGALLASWWRRKPE